MFVQFICLPQKYFPTNEFNHDAATFGHNDCRHRLLRSCGPCVTVMEFARYEPRGATCWAEVPSGGGEVRLGGGARLGRD